MENDFERIERYIRAHYKENITIKSMAQELYISPAYLGLLFSREAGTNVKTYVHSMRMEQIVTGMVDESNTIKDLVYEAGYNNYNNFIITMITIITSTIIIYKSKKQNYSVLFIFFFLF